MIIYTVLHLHDFDEGPCAINIKHFVSKREAVDTMCECFERCCENFGIEYDSDINDFLNYAYIRHYDGDPWGSEPVSPVYDHVWRIITEEL